MTEDRIRLNLEVSREVEDRVARIKVQTGMATTTEVVRRALALLDAATEKDGIAVLLRQPDGSIERLLFP